MILATTSKRNRALIHFLASTGARIGVIDDKFVMKYLEYISGGCKAVLLYPNDNEEYWAFLTPEASRALDEYHEERRNRGETLDENSPIFRRDYLCGKKIIPMQRSGIIIGTFQQLGSVAGSGNLMITLTYNHQSYSST